MAEEGQRSVSLESTACLFFSSAGALLPEFIFFLMSGNVQPNPGLVFPRSVCAENVT